jgi:hypothetical protein
VHEEAMKRYASQCLHRQTHPHPQTNRSTGYDHMTPAERHKDHITGATCSNPSTLYGMQLQALGEWLMEGSPRATQPPSPPEEHYAHLPIVHNCHMRNVCMGICTQWYRCP